MSLMFFISGLFVWPSLRCSGALAFLHGRLLRLGPPFAAGGLLLMPLAYYASWQLTGRDALAWFGISRLREFSYSSSTSIPWVMIYCVDAVFFRS